jgi:hypothetical protein
MPPRQAPADAPSPYHVRQDAESHRRRREGGRERPSTERSPRTEPQRDAPTPWPTTWWYAAIRPHTSAAHSATPPAQRRSELRCQRHRPERRARLAGQAFTHSPRTCRKNAFHDAVLRHAGLPFATPRATRDHSVEGRPRRRQTVTSPARREAARAGCLGQEQTPGRRVLATPMRAAGSSSSAPFDLGPSLSAGRPPSRKCNLPMAARVQTGRRAALRPPGGSGDDRGIRSLCRGAQYCYWHRRLCVPPTPRPTPSCPATRASGPPTTRATSARSGSSSPTTSSSTTTRAGSRWGSTSWRRP